MRTCEDHTLLGDGKTTRSPNRRGYTSDSLFRTRTPCDASRSARSLRRNQDVYRPGNRCRPCRWSGGRANGKWEDYLGRRFWMGGQETKEKGHAGDSLLSCVDDQIFHHYGAHDPGGGGEIFLG